MIHVSTEHVEPPDQEATRRFRFSLKTLLVVTALVAVYFAGRASMRPNWFAPQAGTWQMNMPSGHQRAVALTTLPDGMFLLSTGGNLSGQYRWQDGTLQVVTPADNRYMGLAWQWDGGELVLTAEPPGRPSGATYLGTRLRFVSSDISTATQHSVPVVPSRIAVRQAKEQGGVQRQERLAAFQPTAWRDPEPGAWQLTFPAGFQREAQIEKRGDSKFELLGGGVLNGMYEVRGEQMEIVQPVDGRMIGLAWARENDELVLVSEPSPPPTGARYLGARLRRVRRDNQ